MSENESKDLEFSEPPETVAGEPEPAVYEPEPAASEPAPTVYEPEPEPAAPEPEAVAAEPEPELVVDAPEPAAPEPEPEPSPYEPFEPVAGEPEWELAEPEPAPPEPEPSAYEPFEPVAGEPEWELAEPAAAPLEPAPAPAPVPYQPAPAPYQPAQVPYQPAPGQPPLPKPGQLQTLGILTLIDGILNILWGIGLTILLIPTFVCWPLGIYTFVLGILEIIQSTKLLPDPVTADKPATWLSIMQILNILSGNILSIVTGILGLVFYNEVQVKNYFDAVVTRRYRRGY